MTKEEMAKICRALQAYFPYAKMLDSKEAVALWYMELKELPYEAVVNAIRTHINTSSKVITIHDIKTNCISPTLDWGEAWNKVLRKVGSCGRYQEQKAMESFDETTRKAVRSIGWKQLCDSDNADVVRGQFRMAYEKSQKKSEEQAMLPESLKENIAKLGTVLQIGE